MFSALQPIMRLSLCAALALGLASGRAADTSQSADDTAAVPSTSRIAGAHHARPGAYLAASGPEANLSLDALDVIPAIRAGAGALVSSVADLRTARDADGSGADTIYRVCRVTAYCDRGTTASGVQSGVGQCAAPGDIPFGSLVHVPALNQTFVVTDRTHRRFRNSTIDIFMPAKRDCRQFGRSYLECEIQVDQKQVRQQRLRAFRTRR